MCGLERDRRKTTINTTIYRTALLQPRLRNLIPFDYSRFTVEDFKTV